MSAVRLKSENGQVAVNLGLNLLPFFAPFCRIKLGECAAVSLAVIKHNCFVAGQKHRDITDSHNPHHKD